MSVFRFLRAETGFRVSLHPSVVLFKDFSNRFPEALFELFIITAVLDKEFVDRSLLSLCPAFELSWRGFYIVEATVREDLLSL